MCSLLAQNHAVKPIIEKPSKTNESQTKKQKNQENQAKNVGTWAGENRSKSYPMLGCWVHFPVSTLNLAAPNPWLWTSPENQDGLRDIVASRRLRD